ncbi:MAG: hypothetical protein U0271_34065 [Polyangiaceae bacterium]
MKRAPVVSADAASEPRPDLEMIMSTLRTFGVSMAFVAPVPIPASAQEVSQTDESTDQSGDNRNDGDQEKGDAPVDDMPKTARVRVLIDSDDSDVVLYERGNEALGNSGALLLQQQRLVCSSPCGKRVRVSEDSTFVIGGDGVRVSAPFRLNPDKSEVTLKVHAGSVDRLVAGIALLSAGGVGIIGGGSACVLGALDGSDGVMEVAVGAVVGGAGIGMLIGGIFLLAGASTRVQIVESGVAFAIDERPQAREPRYWLGEF